MSKKLCLGVLGLALFIPLVSSAATLDFKDLINGGLGKQAVIQFTHKVVFTKLVKFKKAVKVLGRLTADTLHVTGVATFDTPISADNLEAIDPTHAAVNDTDGIRTGFKQYKIVDGAELTALLDGSSHTVFTLNENDFVTDVVIVTSTATTTSGATVDVGVGTGWSNQAADPDGFIADRSLTSAGFTRLATTDTTSQTSLGTGAAVTSDTGDVTIQSSTDISGDTVYVGRLIVEYLTFN